jgi:hypothetical protein
VHAVLVPTQQPVCSVELSSQQRHFLCSTCSRQLQPCVHAGGGFVTPYAASSSVATHGAVRVQPLHGAKLTIPPAATACPQHRQQHQHICNLHATHMQHVETPSMHARTFGIAAKGTSNYMLWSHSAASTMSAWL